WGDFTDKTVAARFIHANSDFELVDSSFVIDYLLEKDVKRYCRFCAVIKYMGLEIVAPNGNIEKGFIGIGNDLKGGSYFEVVTDDYKLLSEWIKRFSNKITFYSECEPEYIKDMLGKYDVANGIDAVPQAMYFGETLECKLPDDVIIRPLSGLDKDYILKWANGKMNAYIKHLLNEKHYLDDATLEYGVFKDEELVAVAECGIDEVHGVRLNNCCAIHFADGKATDDMYRTIFSYVVNDVMNRGVLPFDDIQYGEYAKSHGNFTSDEMGFTIVNWSYTITER
ncbi:MAG: hypothetical protein J6B39_02255, partial [Lachnospiraceae bacterium]|nr:hypothetical protein [Lachnospiraceae bacterium]